MRNPAPACDCDHSRCSSYPTCCGIADQTSRRRGVSLSTVAGQVDYIIPHRIFTWPVLHEQRCWIRSIDAPKATGHWPLVYLESYRPRSVGHSVSFQPTTTNNKPCRVQWPLCISHPNVQTGQPMQREQPYGGRKNRCVSLDVLYVLCRGAPVADCEACKKSY